MMFLHPWFLWLLLLVPPIAWRMWHANRQRAVRFSSAASAWHARPTWRQRLMWLPSAMTLLAMVAMIVALARPRAGREQTVIDSEGIAIELVVDRSGSMQALDFRIDGTRVDRLEAIKHVAAKFVLGEGAEEVGRYSALDRDDDAPLQGGRVSDLIGLITFAGYADAITPPTLDHAFLIDQLNATQIVNQRSENGTAIGDAIALAVDKLSTMDDRRDEKVKSKVIILLTDGENTAGEMEPVQAAELAMTMGIKIYTIGVGTKGRAPFPVRRSQTGQVFVQQVDVIIDEATLREIAKKTNGKYFRATDTDSLESIYEEIDQLEKTKVETQQFVDYRELAVQADRIAGYRVPPLLLIAMLLLAGRVVLANTILRQFG